MDAPLIAAGSLAAVGTAVHGIGGELLVVRKLTRELLPATRFGGPAMTRSMIHVSWHLTTLAFLAVAIALLLSGTVLDGDAAHAIAIAAACVATGFALIAVGLGAAGSRSPRSMFLHPGPLLLTVVAALAWWGAA